MPSSLAYLEAGKIAHKFYFEIINMNFSYKLYNLVLKIKSNL